MACGHGNLHIAPFVVGGEQNQQVRIEGIAYHQDEVESRSVCSFVEMCSLLIPVPIIGDIASIIRSDIAVVGNVIACPFA